MTTLLHHAQRGVSPLSGLTILSVIKSNVTKKQKVKIKNELGETFVGVETQPSQTKDKYPTIILVHGFGVTKEEDGMFDDLAKYLADNGILSYRFDFSGRGEREGDYTNTYRILRINKDYKHVYYLV